MVSAIRQTRVAVQVPNGEKMLIVRERKNHTPKIETRKPTSNPDIQVEYDFGDDLSVRASERASE